MAKTAILGYSLILRLAEPLPAIMKNQKYRPIKNDLMKNDTIYYKGNCKLELKEESGE